RSCADTPPARWAWTPAPGWRVGLPPLSAPSSSLPSTIWPRRRGPRLPVARRPLTRTTNEPSTTTSREVRTGDRNNDPIKPPTAERRRKAAVSARHEGFYGVGLFAAAGAYASLFSPGLSPCGGDTPAASITRWREESVSGEGLKLPGR